MCCWPRSLFYPKQPCCWQRDIYYYEQPYVVGRVCANISDLYYRNKTELDVQWVPRDCNEQVDLLSRFVDKDDWAVNARIFRIIDAKWGPHTIDRFASYYSFQLPRINSKHASPRSSGADSFAQDH